MKPPPLVECYPQRGSIDTTFPECRAYLQLESTKRYGQPTVRRFTPGWFGLYTLVVRRSLQRPRSASPRRAVIWRGQATVTFSAMMTCVRRVFWEPWCFHTQAAPQAFSKLSPAFQETILSALAPVAEMAGAAIRQARIFLHSSASQQGKSRAQ
jgi:hypothetical protein